MRESFCFKTKGHAHGSSVWHSFGQSKVAYYLQAPRVLTFLVNPSLLPSLLSLNLFSYTFQLFCHIQTFPQT